MIRLFRTYLRYRRLERILRRMILCEAEIMKTNELIHATRATHSKGVPVLRKRLVKLRAEWLGLVMEYEGIAR
jgi:hypothetical protein